MSDAEETRHYVKSFFLYVPRDSWIHKLNPVTKTITLLSMAGSAFLIHDLYGSLLLLVLTLFLLGISRVPLSTIRKLMSAFVGAVIATTIAWMLFSTRGGDIVYFETYMNFIPGHWVWHIYITNVTVLIAFMIGIRILVVFFLTMLFLTTMRDRDLIYGLRKMHATFTVCLLTSLVFRAMSMFGEDFNRVKEAMMSKGLDFGRGSIVEKIRRYVLIFIPLLILMFKRAEDIAYAIEARGIPIRGEKRTIYHELPMSLTDYVVLVIMIIFFVGNVVGTYIFDFTIGDLFVWVIRLFGG